LNSENVTVIIVKCTKSEDNCRIIIDKNSDFISRITILLLRSCDPPVCFLIPRWYRYKCWYHDNKSQWKVSAAVWWYV